MLCHIILKKESTLDIIPSKKKRRQSAESQRDNQSEQLERYQVLTTDTAASYNHSIPSGLTT